MTSPQRRRTRTEAWAAMVLAAALLAGCGRGAFHQAKALDEHSRVVLEDAWVLEHTPPLLQAIFTYEGADPNRTYALKASLRGSEHGSERGGGWIHQVPIPSGSSTNRLQVMWEFGSFPQDSPAIYLRLDFTDKENSMARSVDFKLPGAKHLRLRKLGSQ